ncbi:GINS complex subunit [Xanthoria parietina]
MDIDDILAEVSGDGSPPETRDLQELTRAWVTERSAPELLPWPSDLMDRVLGRIHQQIEVVEEQVGNVDPKTNFRLIIIQTELERFKYLVRSFLRTRMAKIDQYTLYMLSNPTQTARLSACELQYANSHQTLLEAHYRSSFLSQFPTSLQRLDDTAGGISMIEQPDPDAAVFVRALRNIEEPVVIEGTDTDFQMRRGDVYVVRWSAVQEHVLSGDAELI